MQRMEGVGEKYDGRGKKTLRVLLLLNSRCGFVPDRIRFTERGFHYALTSPPLFFHLPLTTDKNKTEKGTRMIQKNRGRSGMASFSFFAISHTPRSTDTQ